MSLLHRFQDIIAYFPKFKIGHVTVTTFEGRFVVRRLGLAMINMSTEFVVYKFTQ